MEKVSLTLEEKLALFIEYEQKTGEKAKATTVYKGINLGTHRSNLRKSYSKGTLNISEELLEQYIKHGIIVPGGERRKKSSPEEKVQFFMEMLNKSEEERKKSAMKSGVGYERALEYFRREYTLGNIKLTLNQEKAFKLSGILISKPHEKAIDYKLGFINNPPKSAKFVGYRGVVLSKDAITQEQKLAYANLVMVIMGIDPKEYHDGYYIDIDNLKQALDMLDPKEREIVTRYLGIGVEQDGFKIMAKEYKMTRAGVSYVYNIAINKLRKIYTSKGYYEENIWGNIEDLNIEFENIVLIRNMPPKDISMGRLGFSNRAINALKNMGVTDIHGLLGLTNAQLKGAYGASTNVCKEIVTKLARYGMRLKLNHEQENISAYPSINEIDKRVETMARKIKEYEKAYTYYVEQEDIYNPDDIIPGVDNMPTIVENRETREEKIARAKRLIAENQNLDRQIAEEKRSKESEVQK